MHPWADLTSRLATAVQSARADARNDPQLKAFTTSNAISEPVTFGIKSTESDNAIVVRVKNGSADIRAGEAGEASFVLSAAPDQWKEFFTATPVAPYQRQVASWKPGNMLIKYCEQLLGRKWTCTTWSVPSPC